MRLVISISASADFVTEQMAALDRDNTAGISPSLLSLGLHFNPSTRYRSSKTRCKPYAYDFPSGVRHTPTGELAPVGSQRGQANANQLPR